MSFLLHGSSQVTSAVAPSSGCVGFVGAGRAGLHDLDFELYSGDGVLLESDVRPVGSPTVRFCGGEGQRVHLVVRASEGSGEYQWIMVKGTGEFPDLNRMVGGCFSGAVGVHQSQPRLVSQDSTQHGLVRRSSQVSRLKRMGYALVAEPVQRQLPSQGAFTQVLRPPEPGCYSVAVWPGRPEMRVAVDVGTLEERGVGALAPNVSRRRRVRFCSMGQQVRVLTIRSTGPAGPVWLDLWKQSNPVEKGLHVDDVGVAAELEILARFSSRGLARSRSRWVHLIPGPPTRVSTSVDGGRCYGFAVVGDGELDRGDVDMVLTDSHGRWLASDLRSTGTPAVFYCFSRPSFVRLWIQAYGARGAGKVLVGATP